MPVGNVTLTVKDGGLGIVPSSTAQIQVVLGVCTGGTANTLYSFGSLDDLVATCVSGPATEAAADVLAVAGGSVYVMPVTASVVGVASAVTAVRVATSTGVASISAGTPNDAYAVIVKIVSTGVAQLISTGNVLLQYSYDNGTTYSQSVAIPTSGTYVLPGTGLTLLFTHTGADNYDLGDQFTITCQAPFYSSSDLNTAFAALFNDARTWGFCHVVGFPTAGNSSANATASATLAATIDTQMTTAFNNSRYVRAIMEAPPSTDADLTSAFLSFSSTRVKVEAGTCVLNSPLTGRKMTRHWAWKVASRLSAVSVSTSPGRVSDGSMLGVVSLVRDERKTPGLYDQRFGVAQSIIGLSGFYSDLGKTMAPLGSDYSFIMNCRVMDVACTITRQQLLQFLNSSIRVSTTTGFILDQEAQAIEKFIESAIRAGLVQAGDASDCSVLVNRTDNLLSTQLLRVKTRIIPLGYAASISEDIGFLNPSLVLS